MQLVVDANVVISALAKDSAVRAALRTATDDVSTPWYISVEIDEHHTEIRRKSGLSPEAFEALQGIKEKAHGSSPVFYP